MVLDEATSNLEEATDHTSQRLLREEFVAMHGGPRAIAHCIDSIIDDLFTCVPPLPPIDILFWYIEKISINRVVEGTWWSSG